MYICTSVRPLSCEELRQRRSALQDAIICVGWIKLLSLFCYMALFLAVQSYSEGTCLTFMSTLILIIIPFQFIIGLLLFLGAIEIKILALKMAVWLCILTSALNTILGLVGSVYFIRNGSSIYHFLLAGVFAILSLSICSVLCHDIIITLAFIKLLDFPPPAPDMMTPI